MMKTQFGKAVLESHDCVLCGKRPATSKEHIPPQCLFRKKPEQYLTVPACKQCNDSTTLADDDLQVYMVSASIRTEEGKAMYETRVRPKLFKNPATKARWSERLTHVPLDIPGLGRVMYLAMRADPDRFEASVGKLIRGLYWWHRGEMLGQEVPIRMRMLHLVELAEYLDDPEKEAMLQRASLGVYQDPEVTSTFFYKLAILPDSLSAWYFFFYRHNCIIAMTGDPPGVGPR
jgi:hypothetical protein